jgi:hypothetical protein
MCRILPFVAVALLCETCGDLTTSSWSAHRVATGSRRIVLTMSDENQPPAEANETTTDPTNEESPPKTRLRDRAFGLRSVIAVGAATLVLGGLGGTAIGFAADGDSGRGDHPARMDGEGDGDGRPGDHGFAPPPGQVPPVTPPGTEDQPEESPDPTTSSTS